MSTGPSTRRDEAVRLGPGLGRPHAVLGFVHLARLDVTRATAAFEQSIALDPSAPLPRLGLGLAKIRRGDLEGGRQDLEIAVSLDPGDSLLRSYLGKAFYEERRPVLAADQFSLAEKLDPQDPTPAPVRRHSPAKHQSAGGGARRDPALDRAQRRPRRVPVAAAAGSGSGIPQRGPRPDLRRPRLRPARADGRVAVAVGRPDERLAHRFLADAYSVLPRHEIARVSELLQSQLYQPLNLHPVQPEVALSRSFILRGTGPADPSFNEYSQLFERNGVSFLASGLVGSNDTYADQVSVSALYGPVSVSFGQLHYETDGFRPNNDLTRDAYDLFAQVALSPSTSILAELRYEDVEQGDLPLRFDPANFNPDIRQEERTRSARLGARHAFAPGSGADRDGRLLRRRVPDARRLPGIRPSHGPDGWIAEVQYAFQRRAPPHGDRLGYFDADRVDSSTRCDGGHPIRSRPAPRRTSTTLNVYLYTLVNWPKPVTWTLGVSGRPLRQHGRRVLPGSGQPEGGRAWTPAPSTTVRAAFFRTLKRQLVSNQTIEPTQVAGFNQFFDDVDGTDAWRYGVGIDQKIGSRAAIGGEFSVRELSLPVRRHLESRSARHRPGHVAGAVRPGLRVLGAGLLDRADRRVLLRILRPGLRVPGTRSVHGAPDASRPAGRQPLPSGRTHGPVPATYVEPGGAFGVWRRDDRTATTSLGRRRGDLVPPPQAPRISYRSKRFESPLTERAEFHFQDTDPASPVVPRSATCC